MSDNLISVEPGSPAKINLKIIDNNKKIDVEFKSSIETTLLLHNLNPESHPSLENEISELSTRTEVRVSDLLNNIADLSSRDIELENRIEHNKNGYSDVLFSVDSPILPTHAASKDYVDTKVLKPSNVITGLELSFSSAVITLDKGYSLDSTLTRIINLPSSLSKTLAAFSEWNGGGALDVVSELVNRTFYVYIISKENQESDILFSLNESSPVLPNGFVYFRNIGFFLTDALGIPSFSFPCQDIQSAYLNNLLADSNLSNLTTGAKNTVVNLVMPDYSRGSYKAINTIHQMNLDGYLKLYGAAPGGGAYLWVLTLSKNSNLSSPSMVLNNQLVSGIGQEMLVPVEKGLYFKATGTAAMSLIFYPAKGAN